MDATAAKPWYASQTVWGGIAAIGGGLGSAYYGFLNHDPLAVAGGLTAAAGGFHAVVGRFKADTPIGRALAATDELVQTGVALESALGPAKAPSVAGAQ